MMRLNDVLAWIKAHPNQPMVHGGIKVTVFRGGTSGHATITPPPPPAPKTIIVKLNDSVSASAGRNAPNNGINVLYKSGSSGSNQQFVNITGLSQAEATKKIQETQAHLQSEFRNQRTEEDKRNTELANQFKEDQKRIAEQTYNARYPTKFSRKVKGGYVVGETTGPFENLKNLQKQISGSIIVQDKIGGDYKLINATGLDLQKKSDLSRFNINIGSEGGEKVIPLEKSKEGGNAFVVGLSDTAGGASGNIGGQYGEIPEQKPAPEPQISSSNFAYDEGGTVALSEKKYFPRESRQEVKNFLKQNKAESYNIYDQSGKLLKTTSGRNVYPDVLKYSLDKQVSIQPVSKLGENEQYATFGVGNPVYIIPKQGTGVETILPIYGPPEKPESQNVQNKDYSAEGAFKESGSLLLRPVTNIAADVGSLVTGKESTSKPTIVDQFVKASETYVTPSVRNVIAGDYGIGKIRKTTEEEKINAENAFPLFAKETEQQFKENPKEVIFPLLGEVAINVAAFGAVKGVSSVVNYAVKNKYLIQAAKDFREILAPKQLVPATLKEKIPVIELETSSYYHGTSATRAMSILEQGFKTDFPQTAKRVYGSTSKEYASIFAKGQKSVENEPEVILKITAPKTEWEGFNVNKLKTIVNKNNVGEYSVNPTDVTKIEVVKGPKYLIGKSFSPQGTTLSKNIAGLEAPIKSRVNIKSLGGSLVRLESESPKQDQLLFYDVKEQKAYALQGIVKGSKLPDESMIRGSLSGDVNQQIAQQKKFGITQIDKDLFKTVKGLGLNKQGESNLVNALKSESIVHIGNIKTFSLAQIKQNPRAFGRFFFGGEEAPTKALSDIGLLETRGYLTGGTKIKVNRLKEFLDKDIFKPFKEGKVKSYTVSEKPEGSIRFLTTTKYLEKTFTKKLSTSSFVNDLRKNIRFIDPFSKSGKTYFGTRINKAMLGTTDEGFGKYPSGKSRQIFTETKQQRDEVTKSIIKEVKPEMDILFQGPRFKGNYGLGAGIIQQLKQIGTSEYSEPNRQMDRGPRMIESPLTGKYENFDESIKKINIKTRKEKSNIFISNKIFEATSSKKSSINKLLTGIIPSLTTKITPILSTGLAVIPKLTPKTSPRLDQPQAQQTDLITTPELIPDIPFEEPPPPRPFEKIIPTGISPFDFFGGGGNENYYNDKKAKKSYSIFDIAKTPFGKINVYLGYQEVSLNPIGEITRKLRKPIGQIQPANIYDIDYEKLYKKSKKESEYF